MLKLLVVQGHANFQSISSLNPLIPTTPLRLISTVYVRMDKKLLFFFMNKLNSILASCFDNTNP